MEIPLIAGRFAPLSGPFALDLATGERTYLAIERVQDTGEQRRWAERCAALSELWHPRMGECLDFGVVGAGHRFAAYRASRRAAAGEAPAWPVVRAEVEAFLQACGLEARTSAAPFADLAERVLVLPTPDAELPDRIGAADRAPAPVTSGSTSFGIRLVWRPVLGALIERLTLDAPPGMELVSIDAAEGSGGRTLLRACAREARRHGYVPVSTAALQWIAAQHQDTVAGWITTLGRLHLAVLHDGRRRPFRHAAAAWGPLLRLSVRQPRTRLVLELTAAGSPASSFRLAPLSERELIGMVVLPALPERLQPRIERAARASRGRPGRFVHSLARLLARAEGGARKPARYTVHERPAAYGGTSGPLDIDTPEEWRRFRRERRADSIGTEREGGREPPDEIVSAAHALADRGRHAAADRLLRRAHARAVRRGHWATAAGTAVTRALLGAARGRTGEAERLLITALESAEQARAPSLGLLAMTHLGCLRLEDARVEEAESTLRSAAAAASCVGDAIVDCWIASALSLCLWWQGRYEEARRALPHDQAANALGRGMQNAGPGTLTARRVAVLRACTAARIAVALGEAAAARGHLDRAGELAAGGDAASGAMVWRIDARWRVAVGDAAGFRTAVAEAARLAAASRRPLDRLRALVGGVEGSWRLGQGGGVPLVRRLEAAARQRLPGLLAFRIRIAAGLGRGAITAERAAIECAARRLEALVPRPAADPLRLFPDRHARSAMYDDVIEVLGICQEEEPAGALERVLEIVRRRTRAAAAEFSAVEAFSLTQPRGVRPPSIARRVIEAGVPIEPAATDRGTEAGVPLRFGGRVIGALTCRWLGGVPLEIPALIGLLAAVAAAAAPSLHAALDQDRPAGAARAGEAELLGESAAMQEIRRAVARAADAPFPVLIQGESGSGKELVARAIHRAGARRGRPFCALNCAALPDDLLEAELFGHARGAFTGAVVERAGLFEDADGGVLFLDEVGELTPRGQAKLLRAIQEGEIKRLGETFARKVDVRIIAATNRPLEQEVAAGRFRRDLRYRLDVIRITIPPLRDRPDDIPLLAQHLWRSAASRVGSRAVLSGPVLAALARYDWPGNVRELQNVLAALVVSAPRRGIVGASGLPATLASTGVRGSLTTLEEARRVFEARYVRAALARSGGHRGRAAAELGVTRQGLAKLMGRLGLEAAAGAGHTAAPPGPA